MRLAKAPANRTGAFASPRLSKKWLAPLFRGVHSSLAPTARPGSYAEKPLLRKAFCGFDAHVAKSDQSLRGLRPPNPRGFFDRLRLAKAPANRRGLLRAPFYLRRGVCRRCPQGSGLARRGGAGAAALPAIVSPARPHRARGLAFRCLLALVEPPTARGGRRQGAKRPKRLEQAACGRLLQPFVWQGRGPAGPPGRQTPPPPGRLAFCRRPTRTHSLRGSSR